MQIFILLDISIYPATHQYPKKIDYYRRHGIPMSYLTGVEQSLIINLLHFSSSESTIISIISLIIYNNNNEKFSFDCEKWLRVEMNLKIILGLLFCLHMFLSSL